MSFFPNRKHTNPVNRFAANGCRSLAPSNYEIEPVIEETSEYSDEVEESNSEDEVNDEYDVSYENHQQSNVEDVVMNEQSYLTWRKKNSHLFCQKKSQQASNTVLPKKSSPVLTGDNDNLTLLNRINEISRRLEQDNIDSDCNEYNQNMLKGECQNRNNVTGNNEEAVICDKNIQMSNGLNESDDYDRIKELYSKVFPSDKRKLPRRKDMLHDNSVSENHVGSCNSIVPYSFENFEDGNAHVANHHTPKKMVSFERKNSRQNKKIKHNEFFTDEQNSTPNMDPQLQYSNSPNLRNISCNTANRSHGDYLCQNEHSLIPIHEHKKSKNRYDKDEISARGRFSNLAPDLRQRSAKSRDSYHTKNQYCCPQDHQISVRCNESRCVQDESDCSSSTEGGTLNDTKCSHKKYKSRKRKITIDELYKIVKLQNEQITLLQKQIDRLLEQGYSKNSPKMRDKHIIKESAENLCNCFQKDASQISTQGITYSLVKGNSSKIQHQRQSCDANVDTSNVKQSATNVSIGVMTSFVEITQKMQSLTTRQCNGVPNERCDQIPGGSQTNHKRNVETSAKRLSCPAVAEESFTLNEVDLPVLPAVVDEHVPTPQCSLHLDIQDYGSTTTPTSGSSDVDSDSESDNRQENAPDQERVGWTLYDNVVGQINKILQNNGKNPSVNTEPPKTSDVRTATIQQLKKLGVSFVDNDMSAIGTQGMSEPVNNYHSPGTNRPGAKVGHVADPSSPMQYLNEDEILQAAINIMAKRKNGESPPVNSTPVAVTSANANADLSFATMKYMERYQLLPGSNNRETNIVDNRQLQQPLEVRGKSRRNKRQSHRNNVRQQYSDERQQPQRQYVTGDQWPQHQQLQYGDQRPQNFLSNKILDITALKQQPKLL